MEVTPLYTDYQGQQLPSELLYREDMGNARYYYTLSKRNKPKFYMSATTFTSLMLPVSPFLIQWYARLGMEAATDFVDDAADKGTFMHEMFAKLMIEKEFDWDKVDYYLQEYEKEVGPIQKEIYRYKLEKQMLGFQKWIFDYQIKPIAVEYPTFGRYLAGTIDLVANATFLKEGIYGRSNNSFVLNDLNGKSIRQVKEDAVIELLDRIDEKYIKVRQHRDIGVMQMEHMDFDLMYKSNGKNYKKGDPRITKGPVPKVIMVDFKSGKHFYTGHAAQLHIYNRIWKMRFPQIVIEELFNWSPSDWRSEPSYHFKQQTNPEWYKVIKNYVSIANNPINNHFSISKKKIKLTGKLQFGHPVSKSFEMVSINEHVKSKHDDRKKKNGKAEKFAAANNQQN